MECRVGDHVSSGTGPSKRLAKQAAAETMLDTLAAQ
jgi:dsRNA-specific ribonuclease